jgi:hypothetical protein
MFTSNVMIPILLALIAGFFMMTPTRLVKANKRGLGYEYEQPWRRAGSMFSAPLDRARSVLAALRDRFQRVQRHALFQPCTMAAVALLALLHPAALFAMPVAFGVLTEGQHAGEFLMEERGSIGYPSRENITVLSGQNLSAGAVVGRVNSASAACRFRLVVGTGNGTVSVVFAGPEVEVGNYALTCTAAVANGGVFSLTTPAARSLPALTMTPGAGGSTNYRSRTSTSRSRTARPTTSSATPSRSSSARPRRRSSAAPAPAPSRRWRSARTRSPATTGHQSRGRRQRRRLRSHRSGRDRRSALPHGHRSTGAASFTSRQINFTLTDATDFILGNYFDVCVFNQLPAARSSRGIRPRSTVDTSRAACSTTRSMRPARLAGVIVARDAAVMKSALSGPRRSRARRRSRLISISQARGIVAAN